MVQEGSIVYSLRNVVKKREKGDSVFQLEIDDLTVNKGDFAAIVGESGCGKSTLLDMLGLVLTPTSAKTFSIRPGENIKSYHTAKAREKHLAHIRKTHIGYVLQTGGLLPFLTVRENIELPCVINGKTDYRNRVNEIAAALNIANQMDKKPQFLSGGQRQRAAIARALAHTPPIVLADEPTAAVDKYTAKDIMDEFQKLTRELGVTLLMVTHDTNLVAGVANRIFTFQLEKKSQYTRSRCVEGKTDEHLNATGGKK